MKKLWNWFIRFRHFRKGNWSVHWGVQGRSKMDGSYDGGRRFELINIGFDCIEGPLLIWFCFILIGVEYTYRPKEETDLFTDEITIH